MLSHGAMLRCASTSARWLGDSLEKAIMAYPINHVGGLNNICMNVFIHGGCIRFLAKFSKSTHQLPIKVSLLTSVPAVFEKHEKLAEFQFALTADARDKE